MPDKAESGSRIELGKLIELAYLVVILCVFVWAKEFLLPIVLAILISFLLAPLVSRLERLGLHPVLAVLSVAAIAFAIIGGLCSTVAMQALDLANSLPKYQDNIHARWASNPTRTTRPPELGIPEYWFADRRFEQSHSSPRSRTARARQGADRWRS
jgi:predicted PurR-regulated permease PerM